MKEISHWKNCIRYWKDKDFKLGGLLDDRFVFRVCFPANTNKVLKENCLWWAKWQEKKKYYYVVGVKPCYMRQIMKGIRKLNGKVIK